MRYVTGPDEWGSVYVYYKPTIKKGEAKHTVTMRRAVVNCDFDKNGKLLGVEILGVRDSIKVEADER